MLASMIFGFAMYDDSVEDVHVTAMGPSYKSIVSYLEIVLTTPFYLVPQSSRILLTRRLFVDVGVEPYFLTFPIGDKATSLHPITLIICTGRLTLL
jgi:hypothetical protein